MKICLFFISLCVLCPVYRFNVICIALYHRYSLKGLKRQYTYIYDTTLSQASLREHGCPLREQVGPPEVHYDLAITANAEAFCLALANHGFVLGHHSQALKAISIKWEFL